MFKFTVSKDFSDLIEGTQDRNMREPYYSGFIEYSRRKIIDLRETLKKAKEFNLISEDLISAFRNCAKSFLKELSELSITGKEVRYPENFENFINFYVFMQNLNITFSSLFEVIRNRYKESVEKFKEEYGIKIDQNNLKDGDFNESKSKIINALNNADIFMKSMESYKNYYKDPQVFIILLVNSNINTVLELLDFYFKFIKREYSKQLSIKNGG